MEPSESTRPQPPAWTVVDFIHRGYWWRNRGILLLNICLILPLLTSAANGLDSSLVNALQILDAWQNFYGWPTGKILGLVNCAQNIGVIAGLPITPFASDNLGRRLTLIIGSGIMLGGVALQFLATSVGVFIAARIIIGFGLSFCLNAAPLLLIELCYPTQRGKITSLYNSTWYLGSIIAAWICFGTYFDQAHESTATWRIPTLAQAVAPLLQVCLVWFIPESPRYLVSKGYEGRAARVLRKYHANGSIENDPLVNFELAQIKHAIRTELDISKSTSFLSLFATPGNRKRMKIIIGIAVFSQWSGNGLVSYYINLVLNGVGITSTKSKAAINGGLQIFNLFVSISSSMLVDRVGRRPLFILSNSGMLIAFGLWTISEALFNTLHKTAAAQATIPLMFIYFLFYDIAYTPMLVTYTLEILPYNIRAKGFANFTVYLTLIFNQFANPVAIEALGWRYYLVYCGFLIVELVFVVSCIVETKGRTLEETAVLFDGEAVQNDLAATGGEAATVNMTGRGNLMTERSIQVMVAQEVHTSISTSHHSSNSSMSSVADAGKLEK
ncbi:general substrate transporter [Rhodocollybia butyracea]|uniref:General substrate transporter n=1 Tax=Rhodocollybia butyracea TaxID=206335 RepID=A0A9P5PMI2_9AGAR|nr:general substrate transporter [Rhodocollybia butyracea]